MNIQLQTIDSAPAASRPLLQGAQKALGFVPNLYAAFANSPAVLKAYGQLSAALGETSLDAAEQAVVTIAASVDNDCHYCVAAHTTIGQMGRVDPAVLDALRDDRPIADPKLEALRTFTKAVVNGRGHLTAEQQDAFLAAGYTAAQALEVILGVTLKTLSNYTNHLAATPLDEAFAANAWTGAAGSNPAATATAA